MAANRRDFLQQTLMAGGLLALLDGGKGEALAEKILATAGDSPNIVAPVGQHDSRSFWDNFGAAADAPDTPAGARTRGLLHKSAASGQPADLSRQIDFYHYTTDKTLRYAGAIEPDELLDHDGDVTASVNVNGFRMAGDDRQTFDKLQSAQLRIDVLQGKPIMQYLDPMAWMSLAALFPDKSGKLPPLQNLSFDPATTYQKMQQIVLPGGAAQLAVNVSMAHKDSTFMTIVKTLTTEVDRFSPVLGLPAISITALKGFCTLYGAMEQRTTFLLNSMPTRAFATQAARSESQTQQGINLVAGDYILVPHMYSEQLAGALEKLEMRQGYLVPKGSSTNTSVYELATKIDPDITYLSASVGVKPAPIANNPVSSGSRSGSSSDSSGSGSGSSGKSGKGSSGSGKSGSSGGASGSGKGGAPSGSSGKTSSGTSSGTNSGSSPQVNQ